jgi:hypothetical protein
MNVMHLCVLEILSYVHIVQGGGHTLLLLLLKTISGKSPAESESQKMVCERNSFKKIYTYIYNTQTLLYIIHYNTTHTYY